MPKHNFKRDHRAHGGPVLSMCNSAPSFSEFMKDFEERWKQKCEAIGYEDEVTAREEHRIPVLATKQIQAEAMTPEALAVKRSTKGIRG